MRRARVQVAHAEEGAAAEARLMRQRLSELQAAAARDVAALAEERDGLLARLGAAQVRLLLPVPLPLAIRACSPG